MRVEIYKEKPKDPEKVLRLRLAEDAYGVHLVAVDENGVRLDRGSLMSFYDDGGVELHAWVDRDLPLPLTADGHIRFGHAITLAR